MTSIFKSPAAAWRDRVDAPLVVKASGPDSVSESTDERESLDASEGESTASEFGGSMDCQWDAASALESGCFRMGKPIRQLTDREHENV